MMKLFGIILLAASLVAGAAIDALPKGTSVRRQLPSNYTISPIKWTVPYTQGGENMTFYGTVQEVFTLINLKRVQNGLAPYPDPTSNASKATTAHGDATLDRRTYTSTICDVGLPGPASFGAIEKGVDYLAAATGRCGNMAGPGNCGRISCSYDSAIYWCNDNPYYVEYDCSYFASYASDASTTCVGNGFSEQDQTWGQAFDTENFNVMVGSDKC